ncbi:MAG: aromatic amino acid lyase [Myxococcota bacterium]|nr:aromatic amino acid lyase [Myxococcota bacterium]
MADLQLNGQNLVLRELIEVARQGRKVALSADAVKSMEESLAWVLRASEGGILDERGQPRTVYGVNTGFGSLARVPIPIDKSQVLSRNLVRSHAAGVGDTVPRDVARAMVVLRSNALAKGVSGCRPVLVERLLDLLNQGIDPRVPAQGSCGSSGDLAPLAFLGLLIAHAPEDPDEETGGAWLGDEIVSGREALRRAGLEALTLGPKEGLALTNGAQLSTAFAALALWDAMRLVQLGEIAAAMSIEALRGVTRAFQPEVHALRPYVGAKDCAANLLVLMSGSGLVDTISGKVQDAYSLRCTPQVVGGVRDALAHVGRQLGVEFNAATDNPLICLDAVGEDKAYSAGMFHGEPVGLASDYLKIAISELASLAERRLYRLITARLSANLPPSLVHHERPGLGLFGVQTTAAALVSECKALGWPASLDSIPTCEDQEDHVAMSTTASRRAADVVALAQRVVDIELMAAEHALRWRLEEEPGLSLGRGTAVAHEHLSSILYGSDVPSEALAAVADTREDLLDAVLEACPELVSIDGVQA